MTPETADPKRLVVVTTLGGERIVGSIPPDVRVEDREDHMEGMTCVELRNVRTLISQVRIAEGRSTGTAVSSFALIVPVDMASGPIPSMWVRPFSWYFADCSKEVLEKIEEMLDMCQRNEAMYRAKDAGLVVQ